MKWQKYLRDKERDELERLKLIRDTSRDAYNDAMRKLKSRCESRMRAGKDEN